MTVPIPDLADTFLKKGNFPPLLSKDPASLGVKAEKVMTYLEMQHCASIMFGSIGNALTANPQSNAGSIIQNATLRLVEEFAKAIERAGLQNEAAQIIRNIGNTDDTTITDLRNAGASKFADLVGFARNTP